LALIASMLLAAPARADVYDDNLAAASRGAGDVVVLGRGAAGAIYERHLAGGRGRRGPRWAAPRRRARRPPPTATRSTRS
jgi:hypothetical protein